MVPSDHSAFAVPPIGDPNRTKLPNSLVAVVIGLAFLPVTLNGLGVSFSAVSTPATNVQAEELPIVEQLRRVDEMSRGEDVYVVLEWTAFMIALATAVFAVTNYFVTRDVTAPTISTALFFSGMIDAFQALASVNLMPFRVEDENFIPFTWFVSRLVNVCFLIAGTLPFVWNLRGASGRPRNKDLRDLMLAAVLFAVMAYVIVYLCAWYTREARAGGSSASFIRRPLDLIPLFLYLFAGSLVFPRFVRAQPSLFSHALFVSVVPNVAAQFHAAFGSVALYDNGFNIACFHKIIAYLVPFMGLLLDYRRTYYAGVALQVAEEKLRVARSVQQGLLPQGPPEIPGYDVAGFYLPADQVGGDYYDYIRTADGRWGIVVADVSGHEIGASLLMAKTRAYLRALVKSDDDLETILRRLHEFLVDDTHDKWFVTMFFAALDPETATLEYAGAAQQAHLVYCDGSVTVLKSTSTPLGVFADHPPRCGPVSVLRPGEVFIAVTDGLFEARSRAGEQFGQNRILDVVRRNHARSAAEIIEALNEAANAFCDDAPPNDDITVVVVRRLPIS